MEGGGQRNDDVSVDFKKVKSASHFKKVMFSELSEG